MHSQLLPWHQHYWKKLRSYQVADRLPHALLITGSAGLGKSGLADCFAQALLCESSGEPHAPCGDCMSCRLISSKGHPDFFTIEPAEDGKQILVENIREIISLLSLSCHLGSLRVVIIRQAHRMNTSAANALLKTLEEPPDGTIVLLVTAMPWCLPATIVSRCQRLHLSIPDRQTAVNWLHENSATEHAEIALEMARGAPAKALMLDQTGVLQHRNILYHLLIQVAEQRIDPVSALEKCSEMDDGWLLSLIMLWVIDIIKVYFDPGIDQISSPDFRASLQQQSQKLNLKHLFGFLDLLFRSRQRLLTPINKQLVFEEIFSEWQVLAKAS